MASSFEPLFAAPAGPLAGDAVDGDPVAADPVRQPWFARLGNEGGFRADTRFSGQALLAEPEPEPDEPDETSAILADALADAERRGREAALAEMASEGAARAALKLSLQRLDDSLQEELAIRLAETVALLCEDALAPLALNRDALQQRCRDVARLVGEGVRDASLRVHPDDIALLDTDFASAWRVEGDPSLARGTVHFDTPEGVVRNGPAEWRLAVREALGLC